MLVFLGLLLGFGVKMPIVPLHGWLPLAHVEAPSPISILLSGILLKMGAYGLIRAAGPAGERCRRCRTGWRCWPGQPDLRRRPGLAADRSESDDRLLVDLAHGRRAARHRRAQRGRAERRADADGRARTGAGLLFLLIGLLYERTHSRDLAAYGSLNRIAPRFAVFLVFTLLASVGLPGSAGFIAELQVLIGAYGRWGGWLVLLSMAC
jgi:NADH-quinone oxidoreductase subunit M